MTADREPPPLARGLNDVRNVVVAVMLGGGSMVMLSELLEENSKLAVAALVVGVAFLFLLPRPIDLRSGVYAFFVPVAMCYGAATQQLMLLVIGGAVGVSFLVEKTAARRKRSTSP